MLWWRSEFFARAKGVFSALCAYDGGMVAGTLGAESGVQAGVGEERAPAKIYDLLQRMKAEVYAVPSQITNGSSSDGKTSDAAGASSHSWAASSTQDTPRLRKRDWIRYVTLEKPPPLICALRLFADTLTTYLLWP